MTLCRARRCVGRSHSETVWRSWIGAAPVQLETCSDPATSRVRARDARAGEVTQSSSGAGLSFAELASVRRIQVPQAATQRLRTRSRNGWSTAVDSDSAYRILGAYGTAIHAAQQQISQTEQRMDAFDRQRKNELPRQPRRARSGRRIVEEGRPEPARNSDFLDAGREVAASTFFGGWAPILRRSPRVS